jgi:hypothetical protein
VLIFIALLLIITVGCNSTKANTKSTDKSKDDQQEEAQTAQFASRYKAIDWESAYTATSNSIMPATIDIQNTLMNSSSSFIFKGYSLDDIYRKQNDIYAMFDSISLNSLPDINLYLKVAPDNENKLRSSYNINNLTFQYNLIVKVTDVVKPEVHMSASKVDDNNTEIDVDTNSSLFIYGELVDFESY